MLQSRAQREKAYKELCKKVYKIHKEAARYMRSKECRKRANFTPSGSLWSVFIWEATPQGRNFWLDIAGKLG